MTTKTVTHGTNVATGTTTTDVTHAVGSIGDLVVVGIQFESGNGDAQDAATPITKTGSVWTWTKILDTVPGVSANEVRTIFYAGYATDAGSFTFTHNKSNASAINRRMSVWSFNGVTGTLATDIPTGNRIVDSTAGTDTSQSITPAAVGSHIIGGIGDWNQANAFVALTNNTIVDTANPSGAYTGVWVEPTTNPLTSGSAFTWGANCTGGSTTWAVFEVVAASGGGALTASLFSDTDTFFSPTVVGPQVLTPSLFTDNDVFQTHTIVNRGDLLGTFGINANSITASFAATGTATVAVGDLIISLIAQQTALTVTGVTDNLGNTYSAQNAGTDAGNITGRLFYSIVTNAGTLTSVTAACTASTNDGVHIAAAFKGPFTSIDANVANITSDVSSPFTCPSSGTLAQAQEMVIGWGAAVTGTAWTATSPNLVATERANSTTTKAIIGYQTVSATTAVAPVFAAGANPSQAVLGTLSLRYNLTQALTASLFTDGDEFFSATVSQGSSTHDLQPGLFTDTDSFFSATVAPGSVALTAPLFTDTDTIFNATVTGLFTLVHDTPIADTDTFFNPTVTVGGVTLTTGLFADSDSFFSATITTGSVGLTASLYTDTDSFYSATVTQGGVTLSPSLYTDTDSFHSATITTGVVDLAPGLFVDSDQIFSATITVGSTGLTAALFTDTETFFGPTLTVGAAPLVMGLFTDTDSFYTHTALGAGGIAPPFYTDADVFQTHTISGSYTLGPALFSDTDVFFTPVATSTRALTASLYTDTDSFASATVTQALGLALSLYVETDTFFVPTITTGGVTLQPSLFVDQDFFATDIMIGRGHGGGTSSTTGPVKKKGMQAPPRIYTPPPKPSPPMVWMPPRPQPKPQPPATKRLPPLIDPEANNAVGLLPSFNQANLQYSAQQRTLRAEAEAQARQAIVDAARRGVDLRSLGIDPAKFGIQQAPPPKPAPKPAPPPAPTRKRKVTVTGRDRQGRAIYSFED